MLETIKRTGVFLIMAETLYQFVQENRYARYVRLLIRLMTLAILILPVLELIRSGSSELFLQKIEALETEYTEFVGGSAKAEETENMEDLLASHDNTQNVTAYTEVNIKDTCNKCARKNGYQIADVSVTEEGICFRLEPLSSANTASVQSDMADPYGTAIQVEPIRSVEEVQITDNAASPERAEIDFFEEEQRMRMVLADYLNITDTMIEVRIDD